MLSARNRPRHPNHRFERQPATCVDNPARQHSPPGRSPSNGPPGDAVFASRECPAATPPTIAFVFSVPYSWLSHWRHSASWPRATSTPRRALAFAVGGAPPPRSLTPPDDRSQTRGVVLREGAAPPRLSDSGRVSPRPDGPRRGSFGHRAAARSATCPPCAIKISSPTSALAQPGGTGSGAGVQRPRSAVSRGASANVARRTVRTSRCSSSARPSRKRRFVCWTARVER